MNTCYDPIAGDLGCKSLRSDEEEPLAKEYSDERIRQLAENLGDWIQEDAVIHIPLNAPIERDDIGAWVDCKILVPLQCEPQQD